MRRIANQLSMPILVALSCGTFVSLLLTAAARNGAAADKKDGMRKKMDLESADIDKRLDSLSFKR